MAQPEATAPYPEGIAEAHASPQSALRRYQGWIALLLLATLIAAALLGVLGGHANPTVKSESSRAELTVNAPQILRSGEFFEMRFHIRAKSSIDRPVIAISHSYLRDLTLNTFKPSPAEETSDGRFYRMEFDAMEAGDSLQLAIDGQVNPDLFAGTQGSIQVLDDETPITSMPLKLKVRP